MAYDKLVDSTQLNSDLGDVADAIRAKSGGSSPLTFPSGFISEIGNISTGGGNTLESDFLKIHKETVVTGANTVSTSAQYQTYLMGLVSIPGKFVAMSIHQKTSYQRNEYANGTDNSSKQGYRYRSTWASVFWNNPGYDAMCPEDISVDVYTCEILNPTE